MDYVKEQMKARDKMISLINEKAVGMIRAQKQSKNKNVRLGPVSVKIRMDDGKQFEVILTSNKKHNEFLLKSLTFYKLLRLAYWVENEALR